MPMFIPESLLQKEKDHVEGFAPEVAWVTYGGSEKLEERLCVRPTSETLFCDHYKDIVHSPTATCRSCTTSGVSVVRWEKTTRPFLRSREFLWQEGHTMHATAEEAIAGDRAYAERLRRLLRKVPGNAGSQGQQDRKRQVRRRRGDLCHRGD